MQGRCKFIFFILLTSVIWFMPIGLAAAFVKGIYITQPMAENSKKLQSLISNARTYGIHTFVIDVSRRNTRYGKNIAKVKQAGLQYVARLVVFPWGGVESQIRSQAYWLKRWRLAQYAIALGANAIQLDYIRYKPSRRASTQNARDISRVIEFFRHKMAGTDVKLQIDVFGVAAHKPSLNIGQNVVLFAQYVDAINPMVYPSHYEPFLFHAKRPYKTVLESVRALKIQLKNFPNVKVHAFIELGNYRYRMSRVKRYRYIQAQMQAARDAGADGWYVWSAKNHYKILFQLLKMMRQQ